MTVRILVGDVRESLRDLPSDSVHCVVTSPPYWGLRDYGVGHDAGEIGSEPTFAEHVDVIVSLFEEVRRVLRPDGTCWFNYGDAYASGSPRAANGNKPGANHNAGFRSSPRYSESPTLGTPAGMKPKDLLGMPWSIAFALRDAGWWLRQEIIWAKPNPMPEPITDRCTKAHEHVFLLAKSARYFYDAEAIREPAEYGYSEMPDGNYDGRAKSGSRGAKVAGTTRGANPEAGRNARSVWTITTKPFPSAHFATFPPELARRCILAGTSEKGACAECGAPVRRVVEASGGCIGRSWHDHDGDAVKGQRREESFDGYKRETVGWEPSCECGASTSPCVVLDPFGGAGTTGLVADRNGRDAILCEINPEYAQMARDRIAADAPMFARVEVVR